MSRKLYWQELLNWPTVRGWKQIRAVAEKEFWQNFFSVQCAVLFWAERVFLLCPTLKQKDVQTLSHILDIFKLEVGQSDLVLHKAGRHTHLRIHFTSHNELIYWKVQFPVAQLVDRMALNRRVIGLNPSCDTCGKRPSASFRLLLGGSVQIRT